MTIRAKFAGTCRKCGQPIAIGETIEWEKGRGASHVECPKAASAKIYCIAGWESTNPAYPWRVLKSFDSPEEMISHILQANEADLAYYTRMGMAVSNTKISEGKCIPRHAVVTANTNLVDSLERSRRDGAREAAKRLLSIRPKED